MTIIAIAGGTGTVGRQLTQDLLSKGARVRVLTRDVEKAKAAFGTTGAEIFPVNFDDAATLEAAFKGVGRAFLCMGTSDRQVRNEIALIDAAVNAGVAYLVNLSVGGAGGTSTNNVLQWHTEIDAHLATKNVQSTLLRPSTYADTILHVAAGFIPAGAWGGTTGNGKASFIDTRDVADVAAAVLLEGPAKHAGKIYTLTGPLAVSMEDIAGYLGASLHRTVHYQKRNVAEQRGVYASVGLPQLMIDVLLGLDDLTRDGVFATPTSTVRDLTGHAARPVEALVSERAGDIVMPA